MNELVFYDIVMYEVVGILICLGLSAFFSSSETALTTLGPARTQQLLESGERLESSLQL